MDNDNYNDIDYEEFRVKKHGPVFRTFKWITLICVGILFILLIMRIYVNNNVPKEAKQILWDEAAYAAYTEDPEGFVLISHPINSYVDKDNDKQIVRNNFTDKGYFSFSDVYYSPTVEQVQFTVKYNVSTPNNVKDDLELDGLKEGEPFLYVLEDEDGNRYSDYVYAEYDSSFLGSPMYEYRRLLFTGIDISETELLTLKVYYVERTEADDFIREIVIYDKGFERAEGVSEYGFASPEGVTEGLRK